jgi:MFS family permease
MIWLSIGTYFIGLVFGVFASQVLDVQIRRPGLKISLALGMLGILITIFLVNTNTTMPDWLLMSLWLGIGLLAGLGSRKVGMIGPSSPVVSAALPEKQPIV